MKTPKQIRARILSVTSDARYQAALKSPALVQINAPLALIQVAMKAEVATLKWVLKNEPSQERTDGIENP